MYDAEKGPDEIERLVRQFLGRDYHNPLAGANQNDIKFELLKCLDLYHSKELNALAKRVVLQPHRTMRK